VWYISLGVIFLLAIWAYFGGWLTGYKQALRK